MSAANKQIDTCNAECSLILSVNAYHPLHGTPAHTYQTRTDTVVLDGTYWTRWPLRYAGP